MSLALKIAGAVALLYALVLVAMYFSQRSLIYRPDRTRVPPALAGLMTVEERVLKTPDGEQLVAWHAAARPGRPTLLYFHGNAGNLANRAWRVATFMGEGLGVLMLSYRSYSGSSGRPSEAANVADAVLAYDALVKDGHAPEDIVLYGESLGSGVAVQLAAQRKVAGVILDAPYTSMTDMAAELYPWLWVRPFVLDTYDTMARIAGIRAPLLVLHGEHDMIVPVHMGRKVFAAAREPKRLATYPHGGHVDLFSHGALDDIRVFIDEIARARSAKP